MNRQISVLIAAQNLMGTSYVCPKDSIWHILMHIHFFFHVFE